MMDSSNNLYVFAIDVSSEMKRLINEIDSNINSRLVEIKKNNPENHVLFLFFDGQVKTKKPIQVNSINSFTIKGEPKFFINDECDFMVIINKINLTIQEQTPYFNVQKPVIFTNQTATKSVSITTLTPKYEFRLLKNGQVCSKISRSIFILSLALISLLFFLILIPLRQSSEVKKIQNLKSEINKEIELKFAEIYEEQKIKIRPIIKFEPKIDPEYLGLISKYIFEFSLRTNAENDTIPYYPSGAYDLENPKCNCPISVQFAEFAVDKIQNDLNTAYINNKYPLYINLTGETDSNTIKRPYKYQYEGKDTDFIQFVLNGNDTTIRFRTNDPITDNKMLACLRSYSIGEFLKHKLPIVESNEQNIKYFATTNLKEVGGEYRKTKIELIYKDFTLFYWFIAGFIVLFLICFWLFVKNYKGSIFEKFI